MPAAIRPARADDLPSILALNEANVPEVGSVDLDALAHLVDQSVRTTVAVVDDEVVGMLVGLDGPGRDYASINYAWFSARYERFLYVDRVAVAEGHRGEGIARRLYDDFVASAGAGHVVLTAEVNIRPRNDASLAFHERFGFRPSASRTSTASASSCSRARSATGLDHPWTSRSLE